MYIKRADLIAWALVFLTTTCFILTYAAPTNQGGIRVTPSVPHIPNLTLDEKEHPSRSPEGSEPIMLSTPQTASPDKDGMGKDDKEKAETAPPEDPSEHPKSSKEPPATNENTEELLYYQITKRIKKCNLTLSDIREVLLQKGDDGDQFMYTLADKLGYLVDGKYDDPHIQVIKSHKKKLITLLETKKAGLSTTTSQEKSKLDSQPAVSEKPPMSAEPASTSEIGYQVSDAIRELGADALYDLLSAPFFSDAFGYKVGIQLRYSANDQHMNYLVNKDVKELRGFMQHILDSKMPNNNLHVPTSNGHQGSEGQEPGQQISGERDPNQNGPTQREGNQDRDDVGPSQESFIENPKLHVSAAAGGDQRDGGGTEGSSHKGLSDKQGLPNREHVGDDSDVIDGSNPSSEPQLMNTKDSLEADLKKGENQDENAGGGSQVQQPSVDSSREGQNEADENGNKEDNLGVNNGEDSNPPPQTNGTPKASKTSQTVNPEDQQEENSDDLNIAEWEDYIKEQRENPRNNKNFMEGNHPDLYNQLQSDDTSEGAVVEAMELNKKLTKANNEDIDGDGGNKDANLEAKLKGGTPEKPPDSNLVKGEVGSSDDEGGSLSSSESSSSSSSFGAWHFLSIFLVLGVVVVVGYLCMHNRKKLREGVASYVNDSSKRRRRAREYKPLIST